MLSSVWRADDRLTLHAGISLPKGMQMSNDSTWQKKDAASRFQEVMEAAKAIGTQRVLDTDGRFEVTFVPVKKTLEELFSEPGPLRDDDLKL